eukprot:CAMPEP_0202869332 /NCGR_PEP_ID=MMETSP1391-20130828/12397_1 /ASSEMBLY_ACC=CAM_ASM_000867 /TAXON_ID=1034604 /ORGANISM="Chlamydomonas leiostraca, Strain SAG 11-49" /LENGTH=140 /DNA_ID=CAMNT_0049549643 /DNA_START=8 /DNA_END=430 /DNA_ORIENTATION=+
MAAEQQQIESLPPDVLQDVDQQVFKDAYCVTNSEAAFLLMQYMSVNKERHGPAWQPPAVVKKTKDYVDKFAQTRNEENMKRLREELANKGLKDFELALISNLMPETADEAMALIPTLKERFTEEQLTPVIDEMALLRDFQ